MLFRKLQDLFDGRNPLSGKLAAEPGPSVQLAQVRERQIAHRALPVRGAVYRRVMNGNKTCIARKLQVRLNKSGAHGQRFTKRSKCVLWGVA